MSLRALIIGINEHDDLGIAPLYGCLADVAGWMAFLERDIGCGPDDLRVLTSPVVTALGELPTGPSKALQQALLNTGRFGRADRKSILAGFAWLVEQVEAGHRGLLFYGGYGTLLEPGKAVKGVEEGARVRAIVPCDARLVVEPRRVRVPSTGAAAGAVEAAEAVQPRRRGPGRRGLKGGRAAALAASSKLSLGPAASALGGITMEFPTVVQGAIPLPDRTLSGVELPAGHALDKARDTGSKSWSALTVVLDTSFEVSEEPATVFSRSLPVVGEAADCLPFYELSSRTICASRPDEGARESNGLGGMMGSLSRTMLSLLAQWDLGGHAAGEVHVRVDHDTLHRTLHEAMGFLGASGQRPTLMGAEHVGQVAFLCRDLGCGCHDNERNPTRGNQGQVDSGVSGFRAYDLRFEVGPGPGAGMHLLGRVLSAGSGQSAWMVNPADPGKYPRAYVEGTEYWRFFDGEVGLFFDAAAQGRLVKLELSLVHDAQDWSSQLPQHVQFVRSVLEAAPRKRHCSAIPPWPAVPAVPGPNADTVAVSAWLGASPPYPGDQMVVRFLRDPAQPQVIQRLVWHHARFSQSGSPTFFGELDLGSTPQVFTPLSVAPALPANRTCWFTADTALGKLPQDP